MKKSTTTKKKPLFTVDLTDAITSADVMLAFAEARFKAGLPLTQEDYDIIVISAMKWTFDATIDAVGFAVVTAFLNNCCECKVKKLPWYKRLWNWITKPFRKNK